MIYFFSCPRDPLFQLDGEPVLGEDGLPKYAVRHDATECQLLIEQMIGQCEHSRIFQSRKEGVFELETERRLDPRIDPRMLKLHEASPTLGLLTDEDYIDVVVDERLLPKGDVRFSPTLAGLSLSDFPENATFGNGVTCGTEFKWGNDIIYLSIVTLTDAASQQVEKSQRTYEVLRALMEG